MQWQNLKQFESEEAPPHAGSMIESFRSIGYSLSTAVADIIDNSISASCKNVWIDFQWKGPDSFLRITDDGNGMTETELVSAMRPGAKNPLEDRNEGDLGRFGLGLKTASFSQCRSLTVATKSASNKLFYRAWNLDYVSNTGKWTLLNFLNDNSNIDRLSLLPKGTTVIWENIDRLVSGTSAQDEKDMNNFLAEIKEMEMHLQMVFHNYIQDGKLSLWIMDRKLEPWDPYLLVSTSTKVLGEYKLRDGIKVVSFVLPHHSQITKDIFDLGSWVKGWNAHQGFYIYRNQRMIIDGEWLGMYKQEEHLKLARISVNVPGTVALDREWQLDIKKSAITLPYDIKQELKKISELTRKEAVEVYRQIGKSKRKRSEKEDTPVWVQHKWNGKRSYQINKEHPIVKIFLQENLDRRTRTNRLFRLIEETLPLPLIIINESENLDSQNLPFEGKSLGDLICMVIDLYQELTKAGLAKEDAVLEILRTEPFNHYPELAEQLEELKNDI
jgi:hypothetical protein